MSETIIGVLIGGGIGLVMPIISLCINQRQLRRERIIHHLKEKKGVLKDEFSEAKELLLEAMEKNNYSIDMVSKIRILFPKKVLDAYNKLIEEKDKRKYKFHYLNILDAMHEELLEIDRKIEEEVNN